MRHYIIQEREGLYSTWNRGIKLSQGEYITIWNVDDIRFPLSIHQQAETLDQNPQADITYGDFYYMYQYGDISKNFIQNKDFIVSPKNFSDSSNRMFSNVEKKNSSKIGYFDEQLKLVADFDFQIRAAINNCIFVKNRELLGCYLALIPSKLSSNQRLQKKEQNVLFLRYGIYDYLNWIYWMAALKYEITKIFSYQKDQPLSIYFKHRNIFLIKECLYLYYLYLNNHEIFFHI